MKPELKKGIYRHYKNKDKLYELIGIANHSETKELLVIYRALYDSDEFGSKPIWARPIDMFMGTVTIHGVEVSRFEYVGELA